MIIAILGDSDRTRTAGEAPAAVEEAKDVGASPSLKGNPPPKTTMTSIQNQIKSFFSYQSSDKDTMQFIVHQHGIIKQIHLSILSFILEIAS
jgi:hypothetical protein